MMDKTNPVVVYGVVFGGWLLGAYLFPSLFFTLLPFVVLGLILFVVMVNRSTQEKQRTAQYENYVSAQANYFELLEMLKAQPKDVELRQATLQAGRNYSRISRKIEGQPGITIFDEVA